MKKGCHKAFPIWWWTFVSETELPQWNAFSLWLLYIKVNSGHNLHILICERLSGGCCIFKGICFVFHHSHRFSASHSVKKVSIKIMSWQIIWLCSMRPWVHEHYCMHIIIGCQRAWGKGILRDASVKKLDWGLYGLFEGVYMVTLKVLVSALVVYVFYFFLIIWVVAYCLL